MTRSIQPMRRIASLAPLALLPLAAALASGAAHAQSGFQDTRALDAAVADFTGRPIGVEGGARAAVDRRLKLAACPTVALSWYGTAHEAVAVRCASPTWRIFVPVTAGPPVPRAATPAAAQPAARPAPVIKRGDPVTIQVDASGFSITRDGIAMSDAPAGGRFLVNVDGGKKPVQAIALESGRATLPGWSQ